MKTFLKTDSLFVVAACLLGGLCQSWGFFAHHRINRLAVFTLPPSLIRFYKPQLEFITAHAVDADKRRYLVAAESPRHYIDIDHYGEYPYNALPRDWKTAENKFTADTLQHYGILPWQIQRSLYQLTQAFRSKAAAAILKSSADLGHYLADAHVPLHTSSNHDGQLTGQQGIHAFWESRVPELLADAQYNYFVGKATYIAHPSELIWKIVLESAAAADTVLHLERELSRQFPANLKYAFELRNGKTVLTYAKAYTEQYDRLLQGMVERRMRSAILTVGSFWYTAWVDAGQPDLSALSGFSFSATEQAAFDSLDLQWRNGKAFGRIHE